jgi:hypothetical protein
MSENGPKPMDCGNESLKIIYMYLILLFFMCYAADKPKIFSYRIITLRDYDFFNQMQLGNSNMRIQRKKWKNHG